MRRLPTNNKKLVPLILCSVLVLQQSLMSQVNASTITDGNGVPVNKDPSTGNFELRPDGWYGDVGYRKFQDFILSQGDVANFIFQAYQQLQEGSLGSGTNWQDVNTFVNLVSNQVQLNGIVNALSSVGGGLKNNGNLVFVSPQGMVVGASGVLNVGSLHVYTPTQDAFDKLASRIPVAERDQYTGQSLANEIPGLTWDPNSMNAGNGSITINGKVLARGDVELHGSKVAMGNGSILLAGVGNETTVLKDDAAANTLFESLVNTDNMNTGNGFANASGKIVITSKVGTSIGKDAKVRNFAANSETSITNTGSEGIDISGEVSNPNGKLTIKNENGALNINEGGLIKNKGTMEITGDNLNTGIRIDGEVENNGKLLISNNTGTNGLDIGGSVTNTGDADILNKDGLLNIDGTVTNTGNLNITNDGTGFDIGGTVTNNTGVANLTNNQGAFNIKTNGKVVSNGTNLNITNNGNGGLHIAGTVDNNTGEAVILNEQGLLEVANGGNVISDGTSLDMTNNGLDGFKISGNVTNNKGIANLTNNKGLFEVTNSGKVTGNGTSLTMTNTTSGDGLTIAGTVENTNGNALIDNKNGELLVDSTGKVIGTGDKLTMTNTGSGFTIAEGGTVDNTNELEMSNAGANGFNILGSVTNNGNAKISNTAGLLNVQGSVTNTGNLDMTNDGSGFDIGGTVTNNTGIANLINNKGAFNVEKDGIVTSNGTNLNLTNNGDGGLSIAGIVNNNTGDAVLKNTNNKFDISGTVNSDGTSLNIENSGANGLNISGTVNNNNGIANITNTAGALNLTESGKINSKGSELNVNNSGKGGMHIEGVVTHNNKNGKVNFTNSDSDMVIGHTNTKDNITSDANVKITVTDGNLLNYGVNNTLIKTTDNANLDINVTNGAIGEEVGPYNGTSTGIGPNQRDLSKSINVSVDGKVKAISSGKDSLVNIASLDKDLKVDQIKSDGRVILLADDSTNKGQTEYDIINAATDPNKPNVEGTGISIIASGNIGEKDNALTFRQNEGDYGTVDDQLNHHAGQGNGVDILAIKDINIKGLDGDGGEKLDTNVSAIISREGNINAEFSGDTYIGEITANDTINITTRGKNMYIENLGTVPTYPEDYYGPNTNIHPDKVKITALDLGTSWPDNPADSTIIIKNGTIEGIGEGRPAHEQDLTLVADNAYAGGYYFNLGKNRGQISDAPLRFNPSTVTKDDRTNTLKNPNGDTVSIRGKAVRPDDVTAIGQNSEDRNYYYGGSSQGNDDGYDGVKDDEGNYVDDPTKEEQGNENDDDNLVIPEPDDPIPGDDDDDDDDGPPPGDDDDDDDDDGPHPGDDDDDDDDDGPPPEPGDDDDDDGPTMDDAKQTWKKEIDDNISVIDKRQYMRFEIEGNPNPVVFESDPEVEGILNISRGGVQLTHNKSLKVGDIVPVHVKYGDVEIKADVKIVSASDVVAGGEFIDLDLATANKLLYLSMLMDEKPQDQYYANTQNQTLSTTTIDE